MPDRFHRWPGPETAFVRRIMPRALIIAALLCCCGMSARALSTAEAYEAAVSAAHDDAARQAAAAVTAGDAIKAAALASVSALDISATAARSDLADLQKQLLAVLSRDDPAAMRVVRARLSAARAALDADEGAKALLLKQVEEADRERDLWKRRAATLDLALRLDLRVMLASPVEIDDREKRVVAANKEIEAQSGQIEKYLRRRSSSAMELETLRQRLDGLTRRVERGGSSELAAVRGAEAGQVRRLIEQQAAWFRLNGQLEERARRNLSFARSEYLVSRRLADALAQRGALQRAADLQGCAERSEAQLGALRTALAPVQRQQAEQLAAASVQVENALKAIGEARTAPEEAVAHAAYAIAQAQRRHCDADGDCWKEFVSLQKAGAAFARERSDRARNLTGDRSLTDILEEELQLRGSLITSEQYVRSFELLMGACDTAIDATRRELGVAPERIAETASALAEVFSGFDATQPPTPALVADLLRALTEHLEGEGAAADVGHMTPEGRQALAQALVARIAQREMLRTRKSIAERWIEHSREAIRTLAQTAGRTLWQEHDLRLNGTTAAEAGGLALAVAGNAWLDLESWIHRIDGAPGVPAASRAWLALSTVLLAGLCGVLVSRRMRLTRSPWMWLARRVIGVLPPLLAAGWWALRLSADGSQSLLWVGLTLLAVAAWMWLRLLLLACCPGQVAPPPQTLAGALFTALNALGLWAAVLYPLYRLAGGVTNDWDVRAVIARLWLFGICLAGFRLALHPTLAGRLFSRRSTHRGLRWFGTLAAVICSAAAGLSTLTYLAGLDNLGGTVLHTAEATFAALLAGTAGLALLGWAKRRHSGWGEGRVALVRAAQTGLLCLAGAGVAWIWWRLLNRVVLASNAPAPIPEMVQIVSRGLSTVHRIWRHPLSDEMTVRSLACGLLVFAASFWVARELKSLFLRRVLSRTPMDASTCQTFTTILGYGVVLMGFLVGLNVAGSSLKNLTLLVGAITVGLGFGLQNVINNFVSSLLIHFGRSIRVGDYIDVGGTRGCVREIGLRNTMIVTDDEITVLVPNGSFISTNIVNWTNPNRRIRLHVALAVMRQADLTAVTELAVATAGAHALVLKAPAPTMEVRTVTAAQVTLDLLVWTEKPERAITITGELSLALDRALRARGFAC